MPRHIPPGWQPVVALLALCVAFTRPAHAQPPITAEVNRTEITADETVLLTIRVNAADDMVSPELPSFAGFDVVGTSTARQITLVNGAMAVQNTYVFQLRANRTGRLTIPAVAVKFGGQTSRTDPIAITVTPGRGPMPATPPPALAPPGGPLAGVPERGRVFVTAEVDRKRPFVGQKVVFTFRLFRDQTVGLRGSPRYVEPPFTGFWNRYQPEQTHLVVPRGEQVLDVAELRTILFPTAAGRVTIGPATLTLRGFFQADSQLQSEPITLDVRPLPAGAPAGFDGAVGQYRLDAALDRPQGSADDPLTLTVTIGGEGNVDALPDPAWPDPLAGWRSLAGRTTTNTKAEGGRVRGERRYERILIPGRAGPATLPPIRYVYFDPEAEAYLTTESRAIRVTIAPAGPAARPPPPSAASSPAGTGAAGDPIAGDLRPLRAAPPDGADVATSPVGWPAIAIMLWLLPVALIGADSFWRRRRVAGAARRAALVDLGPAHDHLIDARRAGTDVPAAARQALVDAAGAVLGASVAGLTRDALAHRLTAGGVASDLADRIGATLEACEAARYAPPSASGGSRDAAGHLVAEAESILEDLAVAARR